MLEFQKWLHRKTFYGEHYSTWILKVVTEWTIESVGKIFCPEIVVKYLTNPWRYLFIIRPLEFKR